MTNKLVVIINSLKVPKIKKSLLYEIKFLVPNYSCLQNPWLGGYRPQIPVLSVLCPQLNLLKPFPPRTKFLGTPLAVLSYSWWLWFKCRSNHQLSRVTLALSYCNVAVMSPLTCPNLGHWTLILLTVQGHTPERHAIVFVTCQSGSLSSEALRLTSTSHYPSVTEPNDLDLIHYVTALQSILRNTTAVRILVFRFWKAESGPGSLVGIATELRAGRSGIESRWRRDFPPVQTDPVAHSASYKLGIGSFPGVKCDRGVLLTTQPF